MVAVAEEALGAIEQERETTELQLETAEKQVRTLAATIDEFAKERNQAEQECTEATARLDRLREVMVEREAQVASIAQGEVALGKLEREQTRLTESIRQDQATLALEVGQAAAQLEQRKAEETAFAGKIRAFEKKLVARDDPACFASDLEAYSFMLGAALKNLDAVERYQAAQRAKVKALETVKGQDGFLREELRLARGKAAELERQHLLAAKTAKLSSSLEERKKATVALAEALQIEPSPRSGVTVVPGRQRDQESPTRSPANSTRRVNRRGSHDHGSAKEGWLERMRTRRSADGDGAD